MAFSTTHRNPSIDIYKFYSDWIIIGFQIIICLWKDFSGYLAQPTEIQVSLNACGKLSQMFIWFYITQYYSVVCLVPIFGLISPVGPGTPVSLVTPVGLVTSFGPFNQFGLLTPFGPVILVSPFTKVGLVTLVGPDTLVGPTILVGLVTPVELVILVGI